MKKSTCILSLLLLFFYSCKKESSTETVAPVAETVPTTTTTPVVSFISRDQLFTSTGYWSQQFTLAESRKLVLYGAAQFAADIAVFNTSEFSNFSNNLPFTKLQGWYNGAGYATFTLPAGTYNVGIRNNNLVGSNRCVVKLDYDISLPSSDNCSFISYLIQETHSIPAGQSFAIAFNYDFGYRYFLDGCNTGVNQYIMTDVDYNLFNAGNAFQYVSDYSGLNNLNPGFWELKSGLLIGNVYYVVFKNNTSSVQTVSLLMEKWKKNY